MVSRARSTPTPGMNEDTLLADDDYNDTLQLLSQPTRDRVVVVALLLELRRVARLELGDLRARAVVCLGERRRRTLRLRGGVLGGS